MRSVFLLLLVFFRFCCFAESKADSLYFLWQDDTQHDTIRFKYMKKFIWDNYLFSNPDTACVLGYEQLAYAVKRKNISMQSDAYNTIGISWYFRSEFDSALVYYNRGLDLAKSSGQLKSISPLLNNIGTIEQTRGNYNVSIDHYRQSLRIEEYTGNKLGQANCLNNIGIIYYRQQDYPRAKEYYLKAGALYKEIGKDANQAVVLNNLGVMENDQKNYKEALKYNQESYKIRKKNNDLFGMAASLNNMGTCFMDQGQHDSALFYFFETIKVAEKTEDLTAISAAYNNISNIYVEQKRYEDAIRSANLAYDLARKIGAIGEIKNSALSLYNAYSIKGDYKKAFEMHVVFTNVKDSISSEENKDEIIRQEYKSEYEKIAIADSLQSIEEKKLQAAALETEREKNAKRQQFSAFLIIGLIAVLIFAFIIYKRLRITKEQNVIIEQQKYKVSSAYDQLEEKNKEILDSITYAKRIQSAILPSQKLIAENLKDSFVLYQPKDIVAGDFYWIEPIVDTHGRKQVLFAAADCTGHGVPGALVSVICNNALNRAVRECGLIIPGEILNKTREIVIQEFEKSDEEVKDGMDISLVCLAENKILWAGANNPLWIWRSNTKSLEEIKPDKQPIGKYAGNNAFTTHEIAVNNGDILYVFTDGFQDQFGGERGKKFKASSLKELILSVAQLPMKTQKDELKKSIEVWRGNIEQIDDICVFGVKV